MKILFAMHGCMDLGGIINYVESLAKGFSTIHAGEISFVSLMWKEDYNPQEKDRGGQTSVFGMKFNQRHGWELNKENIFCYKKRTKEWQTFANEFDLVIWITPVPSANKKNKGNDEWPSLYNLKAKQIAIVHDGNLISGYPWLSEVSNKMIAIVGVHPCAYNSLKELSCKRALIYNPQVNINRRMEMGGSWQNRKGWVSLQTFKGWKRVPDLVKSVPFMNTRGTLIGTGIDYCYLTSKTKCKWPGAWDSAIKHGMIHKKIVSNEERDSLLARTRCLIDPSWSKKYAKIGDHFNRVVVDAIISGAIPIARNLGISTNESGIGTIFKPEENYIMIPWNATPREFANKVDAAMNMSSLNYESMIENGRSLLTRFSAIKVAEKFIDIYRGECTLAVGETSDRVRSSSQKSVSSFFSTLF